MSVLGYSRSSRSYVGLRASAMALALVSARYPQPSRMIKTSGFGRFIKLLASRLARWKLDIRGAEEWGKLERKEIIGDGKRFSNLPPHNIVVVILIGGRYVHQ